MTTEAAQRIALCKQEKSIDLDLSGLGLTSIPEEVGELVWLEELDLSNNQIQAIQGLDKLSQLYSLSLSNNQIQIIQGLDKLSQLSWLYLQNNQIQTIQGLDKLSNLSILFLDNNQIQILQGLDKLSQLYSLSLSNNQIQIIQGLDKLSQLSRLYLDNNQIQIIQGLDKLSNLSGLYLENNQIQILQGLDKLSQLSSLSLNNNQIQILQGLDKLSQLSSLSLHNNQIQIIQGLNKLSNLSWLYLQNNQIQIIQGLDKLQQLQTLNLSENPITNLYFTELLPSLSSLPLYWKNPELADNAPFGIYLHNCHQLVEPSPAWVQLGKAAVQDYFQAIQEQGKVTLREAKLMLVGRPHMGKTTLSGKLRDINSPMPPTTASTKGIEVETWEYEQEGATYTIRIWDFGGQDIQYSLHQFFMTERAVYGLLDSTREYHDQAAGGDLYANYWLQTIDKLAKGSPTFHIYNHYEGQTINTSIHSSLCGQYKFMNPKPFVVDLAHVHTKEEEQKALESLQSHIKAKVAELPNVGLVLPKKWAAVRQKLLEKAQTTPILSLASYEAICQQQGIQDGEVRLLISSYLHEIGSIIHYNQDKTSPLYKLLILQRNWATEAVYKVALSPLVGNKGGLFERKDLVEIWQAGQELSEEQAASYQRNLPELLELLQKFEICYPYGEGQFLVPQQVSPACPDALPLPEEQALQLKYQYGFMPYGLVYRLAVRLHSYILENYIWRTGMLLTHEEQGQKGCIVLQEERKQQQGSIHLSIYGNKTARYFLQKQIDKELKDLHRVYNMEELVDLLVPCTCAKCEQAASPYLFNYHGQLLSKLKARKGTNIECHSSWEDMDILSLIDHAFLERPPEVKHLLEQQKREKGLLDKERGITVMGNLIQTETMQVHHNENSNNNNSNSHNTAQEQGAIQIGNNNTADNSQAEGSSPIPKESPKEAWYQSWWIWVGLSAFLAAGVTWWLVVEAFPAYAVWVALGVGALTAFLVYRLHPKFIYKNYAWLFFGAALSKALFSLGYNFIYHPSDKLFFQLESTEDWVDLCLIVAFLLTGVFCLVLHSKQNRQK